MLLTEDHQDTDGITKILSGTVLLTKKLKISPADERWFPFGVVLLIPVSYLGDQAPAKCLFVIWFYCEFCLVLVVGTERENIEKKSSESNVLKTVAGKEENVKPELF